MAFFTNEEGARFAPDMLGSSVYAGALPVEVALDAVAIDGAVLADELARMGYVGPMPCPARPPRAFVELHIEQGPVLEAEQVDLGVVTGVQGISWQELHLVGQSNHAGTTPIALRRDAGYVAAAVAVAVRELAEQIPDLVGTVGRVEQRPGLINVVPASATITVDLRHPDDEVLDDAEAAIRTRVDDLAEAEGVSAQWTRLARFAAVEFAPAMIDLIEQVARRPGPHQPPDAIGRRPRRPAAGLGVPGRHDLHPQRERHQPQPGRAHRARRPGGRGQRPVGRAPGPGRSAAGRGVGVSRPLRVAAAQLGPIARAEPRSQVVERLIALLQAAAADGAALVAFPELALTSFFPRWWFDDQADLDAWFEAEMPGPETKPLFDEARHLGVGFSLGFAELATGPDGRDSPLQHHRPDRPRAG